VSPQVGQAVLALARSYWGSGPNSARAGRRHRLPHLRSSRHRKEWLSPFSPPGRNRGATSGALRLVPVFAALLLAAPLFPAAGGGATAIDSAGNVRLTASRLPRRHFRRTRPPRSAPPSRSSGQDGATAITTDAQGNVYVAGYTYSADFPVTPGVVQPKNAGPISPAVVTDLGAARLHQPETGAA
jgi:hypothetical protein